MPGVSYYKILDFSNEQKLKKKRIICLRGAIYNIFGLWNYIIYNLNKIINYNILQGVAISLEFLK
jgi:hypothetical protein